MKQSTTRALPILSLRDNAAEFTLLVADNALVGAWLDSNKPSCHCWPTSNSA